MSVNVNTILNENSMYYWIRTKDL